MCPRCSGTNKVKGEALIVDDWMASLLRTITVLFCKKGQEVVPLLPEGVEL